MSGDSSKPPTVFKKFRFLGQRWRFLKSDIQQESFPGFKRVCVGTLNLSTSFMTHESHSFVREGPADDGESGVKSSKAIKRTKTTTKERTGTDFLLPDDISEQDRLLVQLRNAQLFHRNNMYPAELPVEETFTLQSPRLVPPTTAASHPPPRTAAGATSFDTGADFLRVPESVAVSLAVPARPPSAIRGSKSNRPAPTKRELVEKYSKKPKPDVKLTGKHNIIDIEELDIAKCFRAYSVEKGHRIPVCLANTGDDAADIVPAAASPSKSRSGTSSLPTDMLTMSVVPIVPAGSTVFPSRPKSRGATRGSLTS